MSGEPIVIFGSSCLYFHPLLTICKMFHRYKTVGLNGLLSIGSSQLIHLFDPHRNISKTITWIDIKFCTDSLDSQRMNCADFGNPLTFHLAPPAGFQLSSEISQHLQGSQAMNNFYDP